ncbi:nuclear receptor 2C2-associated protein [Harpegnathos saltator]|uniref:Nuclear receptor 2C2-associated protein n=1 Tax=Harpegnathos saltator TaxID=610380 RepID=E2BUQ1_HARSA|nr:nuclear receptor 2C2-associated protein [Harpegnathos saltator]XP_011145435.1 nuclear receptor 2C2-associated protein [Harpegnathos saltator]EFN80604.1 Nuclear receptor 2C2-associated protein [Harpegnathos saltator]
MLSLLEENKFECRVSSVLNKNIRSYGKKHMFDKSNETCWNSDAGTPQWVIINFEKECSLSSFEIEFQGGFVGKDCYLEAGNNEKDTTVAEAFYPEDVNNLQRFNLVNKIKAKTLKFIFNQSTDFFGRIIIYNLSLYS